MGPEEDEKLDGHEEEPMEDPALTFERNSLLFPGAPVDTRKRCPKCGHTEFSGRNVGGIITYKCADKTCKNTWSGGLPRVLEDPRRPLPKIPPQGISFEKNPKNPDKWIEVHSPVDTVQPFRKGFKLPEED